MRASTKRALSILFSVFFLIITVIVYTNLILPEIEVVNKLRGEVVSKNQNYLLQKNAVSQVSQVISNFKNATDLQKTLSFAMPIKASVKDVLNQWHAISRNSEANITALEVKVSNLFKKPANPLLKSRSTIDVSLEALGTYDAIKQFLNSLETNSRVVSVKNFSIVPVSGAVSSGGILYSIRLEVETYYQVE